MILLMRRFQILVFLDCLIMKMLDDYYFTKRNNVAIDYKYIFDDNKNLHLISSYGNFNRRKNTYFKDLTTLKVLTNNSSDQDIII